MARQRCFYVLYDGNIYNCGGYYRADSTEVRYTGEWEERKVIPEFHDDTSWGPYSMDFIDYDENIRHGDEINERCYLSQTLFNNDDAYEYIRPLRVFTPTSYEADRDEDGEIDYIRTEYRMEVVGFEIVNENGKIIQTIKYDEHHSDNTFSLIKVNGKYFISVGYYSSTDNSYYCAIYSFTPGTTNIRQVGQPIKTSVRQNDELVTVEVAPSNAARQLTVTGTNGMTVCQQTIPAGQTTVQLDAARLAKGVNIVSVSGEKAENCKVIIR